MSERVSSIPARGRAFRGRFLAPFPLVALTLVALTLVARPAAAQVGSGEWAPSAEVGFAVPALAAPGQPALQAGAGITTHLFGGPVWQVRAAVTVPREADTIADASVAAIATLDMISLVPYAGLSLGTRYTAAFEPTLGVVAGLDRRTARDHAAGLLLRFDIALPTASYRDPTWSGALLLSYRWIIDTLATPKL